MHKDSSTASIQGLRTLACIGSMLTHVELYGGFVLDEGQVLRTADKTASVFIKLIYNLFLPTTIASVDIFFFFSGFFFANSVARSSANNSDEKYDRENITLVAALKYLLNRWLRFLPVFLCVAILGKAMGIKPCINWRELAFLDRIPFLYGKPLDVTNMCVLVSWSLFIDFHTHAIMLLLLIVLPSRPAFIRALLSLVFVQPFLRAYYWVSVGMPRSGTLSFAHLVGLSEVQMFAQKMGVQEGNYAKVPVQFEQRRTELDKYFPLYWNPEFRFASILVGTLTWYAMKRDLYIVRAIRQHELMSLGVVALIWIFSMHGSYLLDIGHNTFNSPFVMAYETMGRLAIAMATAVVSILTNTIEPVTQIKTEKGAISKFLQMSLSHPVLVVLSRLTYPMYLLHLFVLPVTTFHMSPKIRKDNYTRMNILLSTMQLFVTVIVFSMPLVIVETLSEPVRVCVVQAFFGRERRHRPRQGDIQDETHVKKC